ncbi:MAG: Gfo/Idh/MocA family oxidoreductase [Prolixibacteraceae bacterium]|nr:Gfo/Idh/MocA family oxidoreductase [Prolixibacteraceae bacterium]MBN2775554.1 Gfo/Idh/MocA family oxidoreductase [Prolixibacteraceae bacterium]
MTIRWGIIGVGDVTEVKSGPAFYKAENSQLVAVMRRNPEKAKDYAIRHNVSKWYSNADELIHDQEVDAVYVATPPDFHADYAIRVMKAGKPVYVEKPMALNYNQCLEMVKISDETGQPLRVAYYRRTLPAFLKVKELIEKGTLGKIFMVQIRLFKEAVEKNQSPNEMNWRVKPEISGAGHFFDLASHQFDYLDFVLGPIKKVKGSASNQAGLYNAEDTVTAVWKHESGVLGSGSWCFVVDKNDEEDIIEFIGEKGKVSLSCFNHGPVSLNIDGKLTELNFENPTHISQNLVQQVVNELSGGEKCVSTGESAARTSWVLDEVVKDYYGD